MKKIYFTCFALLAALITDGQEPFITTWQVTSDNLSITMPVYPDSFASDSNFNNFTIDFGDGTVLNNQSQVVTHTYDSPGLYTVTMSGVYDRISFSNINGSNAIISVEQWGDNPWTSMYGAFGACTNLVINATDIPNLSNVTDMSFMFGGCTSFNQSINNWDVSNVMYMSGIFAGSGFNQPLNNWDVSNVVNMAGMFQQTNFNQPLDNWDVSNVSTMEYMFAYTSAFNQPLNSWDVSGVQNMHEMFRSAEMFNQDLNDWDVTHVTDIEGMFKEATSFNGAISNWDVSNLTSMEDLFRGAISFNQPLNSWDVSNVTIMAGMFYMAYSFNQPLNDWDIDNAYYIVGMFGYAQNFNQDISTWSFSNPSINFGDFVAGTALDTNNYDALLLKLAQLGIEERSLTSYNVKYCDTGVHDYLINELNWDVYGDSLAEECQGNTVYGVVQFDEDGNGCSQDDIKIHGLLVNAVNEPFNYATITSIAEGYSINVPEGTYTLNILNIPSYYTASPASQDFTFTGFGNTQQLDFCLTANQEVNDLSVTIIPVTEARPGFEATYQLVVQNMGTQTVSGAFVSFMYDETAQSFVSADEAPATNTAGQLEFSIPTLQPFESKVVNLVMQTFTPPTVNGDDVLSFTATVTPNTNDYTPADNTFEFGQVVVNSFDPNDKTVIQGDEITISQAEGYLDYVIRFQNTGTASAITVRIEDELDEKLNWATFHPLSASHSYRIEISDNNQVEFIFDNINLPAEQDDEAGSHGFVAFKIKPAATIEVGDVIEGTAFIYFDYNEPIITNTVSTEVVNPTSGIAAHDLKSRLSVYPNPATDIINLKAPADVKIESVKIFNIQGRELFSATSAISTVDLRQLGAGVYLMAVSTNQGKANYRVIKN